MLIKLKSKVVSTRMMNVLLTFFVLCVCVIGLSSMQKVFANSYVYTWTGSVSVNTVAQFNVAFSDSTNATVSIAKSDASTLVSGNAGFSATITSQAGDTNEVWTISHTSKNITGVTLISSDSKFKLGDWTAKEAVVGKMSYLVHYGSSGKEYVNVMKIPGADLKVDNDDFEVSEILDIYEDNGDLMYHTLWFISKKDGSQINSAPVVIIALDLVKDLENDLEDKPIEFLAKIDRDFDNDFEDYRIFIKSINNTSTPQIKLGYTEGEDHWRDEDDDRIILNITLSQEVVTHADNTKLVYWLIGADDHGLKLHDWHADGSSPIILNEWGDSPEAGFHYRYEVKYVELDDASGIWNMKTEDIAVVVREEENGEGGFENVYYRYSEVDKYDFVLEGSKDWTIELKSSPKYTSEYIMISVQEITRVHIPKPYPTNNQTKKYSVIYKGEPPESSVDPWVLAFDIIEIENNNDEYDLGTDTISSKYTLEQVGDKLYIKPKGSTDVISILSVGVYQEHELQKWHNLPADLLASQVCYKMQFMREARGDDVDLKLLSDFLVLDYDDTLTSFDRIFKKISGADKVVNPREMWLLCNMLANQFKVVDHIAPEHLSIVCDKIWDDATVADGTIVKFCFDEDGDGTAVGFNFWVMKVVPAPGEGDTHLEVTDTVDARGEPDWTLATSQCIVAESAVGIGEGSGGDPGEGSGGNSGGGSEGDPGGGSGENSGGGSEEDSTKTINAVISSDTGGHEHWIITITGYDEDARQYTIEEVESSYRSKRMILEDIREYALTISGTYDGTEPGTAMENVPLITITADSTSNTVTISGADYTVAGNTIHLTQLIKAKIYDSTEGGYVDFTGATVDDNSIEFEPAADSEQIRVLFYLGEKKGVAVISFTINGEIILSYEFHNLPVVKYPIKADGDGGIYCISDIEYKMKKCVGGASPTYETID